MTSFGAIARRIAPVDQACSLRRLVDRLHAEPEVKLVAIVNAHRQPVGLLARTEVLAANEYESSALSVGDLVKVDAARGELVIRQSDDLLSMADSQSEHASSKGCVVVEDGRYLGVVTQRELLVLRRKFKLDVPPTSVPVETEHLTQDRFLAEVIEAMPSMVSVKDGSTGRYILLNRAGERLLGVKRGSFLGKTDAELFSSVQAEAIVAREFKAREGKGTAFASEGELIQSDGSTLTTSHQTRILHAGVEGRELVLDVCTDISERKHAEARIVRLAQYDPLTDLANRTLFNQMLGEALTTGRSRQPRVAVLCLDLDRFKSVNDTLGHPVGDLLLQQTADRLRHCVRTDDTIARLGGDEFAIVLARANDRDEVAKVADRIVKSLSAPFQLNRQEVSIGVSIGIALAPEHGQQAEDLLKRADMALYVAKGDGRGTFRFFLPEMDDRLQARRDLELNLRKAIAAREFVVHYQPQFNLGTNSYSGCEALVRWNHPGRGLILPGEFVPMAEEIGLIHILGDWILQEACREASHWPDHIRLSVNLSPVQFRRKGLLPSVMIALAGSGLPPHRLELEITESVLLQDSETNLQTLRDLRDLGVRIAMDDFGTGYSSLGYLRAFPWDRIKVDRTFVRDMMNDHQARTIVRTILDLGNSLGIMTTAEGVETQAQLDELRLLGCAEIQGFLLSRPKPGEELEPLIGRVEPIDDDDFDADFEEIGDNVYHLDDATTAANSSTASMDVAQEHIRRTLPSRTR